MHHFMHHFRPETRRFKTCGLGFRPTWSRDSETPTIGGWMIGVGVGQGGGVGGVGWGGGGAKVVLQGLHDSIQNLVIT